MGVQDFEAQSRLCLVKGRAKVFIKISLLLETVVVVEVVVVVVVEAAVVVMVVLILELTQIRPDEPSNIPSFNAFEVSQAPQSVCEKDDA